MIATIDQDAVPLRPIDFRVGSFMEAVDRGRWYSAKIRKVIFNKK